MRPVLSAVEGSATSSTTPFGCTQGRPHGTVVTNTLPATLTDRLFTGQIYDATIGLYYYNARYYDPFAGQFTQPDSLVADPLNPAAWNRFSYVHNSPLRYTDPTGHYIFEEEPDDPYTLYDKPENIDTLVRAANPESVGLWEQNRGAATPGILGQSLQQVIFQTVPTVSGVRAEACLTGDLVVGSDTFLGISLL